MQIIMAFVKIQPFNKHGGIQHCMLLACIIYTIHISLLAALPHGEEAWLQGFDDPFPTIDGFAGM